MKFREIGGFFELELNTRSELHPNAIKLNSARAAIEYLIRIKGLKKIYLPFYTCEVIIDRINKCGVDIEWYRIDENLLPVDTHFKLDETSKLLYTNYFGVSVLKVKQIVDKYSEYLILDNSQAFFNKKFANEDSIYSPRKFFGVPDGGYLYTKCKDRLELEKETESYTRFSHLIGRLENNARSFYPEYRRNEELIDESSIKLMSELTVRLLQNIDYEIVKRKRLENFAHLHNNLGLQNQLSLEFDDYDVPMIYPFLSNNGAKIKQELISKHIYIPTFWPKVDYYSKRVGFEMHLYENLVPIPIDQRYSIGDMDYILNFMKAYGK